MTPPATDVPAALRRSIRAYFFSVLLYFAVALAVTFTGVLIAKATLPDREAKTAALLVGNLSMLAVVAMSWRSFMKKLRCPACDGPVWWQVSWHFSVFSPSHMAQCPKCSVTLFAPRSRTRLIFVMALAVGVAVAGAVAASSAGARRSAQEPSTAADASTR